MKLESLKALVEDRGILLNGVNDLMEMARQDYGISRSTLIKMQEINAAILKNLKYDTSVGIAEQVNG